MLSSARSRVEIAGEAATQGCVDGAGLLAPGAAASASGAGRASDAAPRASAACASSPWSVCDLAWSVGDLGAGGSGSDLFAVSLPGSGSDLVASGAARAAREASAASAVSAPDKKKDQQASDGIVHSLSLIRVKLQEPQT